MSRRPCLAITLGDPCGIGPELLIRSLGTLSSWADLRVIGARAGLDLLEVGSGHQVKWSWHPQADDTVRGFTGTCFDLRSWASDATIGLEGRASWFDPTPEISASGLQLGRGSAASGRATVEAIRVGADMALRGEVDALVTLPMAKSAAHLAGYEIPGHTEFLQALAGAPITRMAFVSPTLSVVLHTVHQSLRSVVEQLDSESVAETLVFAAQQFIQLTGKADLRVALCALNPHAGEQGAFGREEDLLHEAILSAEAAFMSFEGDQEGVRSNPVAPPAETQAGLHSEETTSPGLEVAVTGSGLRKPLRHAPRFFGPLPSDSLFHRAAMREFDLVVALYHDQGLIPVEVLEPARAVNLTLGLPFIRTSPDHGTAFDKAGRWISDPTNFMEAAALAIRLAGQAKGFPWHPEPPGNGA